MAATGTDQKQNDASSTTGTGTVPVTVNAKKILMIVGDYGEDYEIMVPYQTLSSAGYEVHAVCPDKKKGDKIKTSIHDFEGAQTYSEKPGHNFKLTYNFVDAQKNVNQYIGLCLPGGRAPEYLSCRKDVIDLVTHFTSNDLPIGAICHGPLILAAVDGYLKNKQVTCYSACKPVLDACLAKYQAADPITKCFTDNKLVTGAAWPAHPQFLSQFMTVLGAKFSNCSKKILIIAGDYVEDYEIMCVYQMLLTFGYSVDTVCPNKNAGDIIKTCVHDFEGAQTYSEKPGHNFKLNKSFNDLQLNEYDALYIPGGRAPEYLSINDDVIQIVKYFNDNKKIIASICHGILLLAAANILNGRQCTAYPACKPIVDLCNCKWLDPVPITKAFTDNTDTNKCTIITGAAWPGHIEFVKKLMQALGANIQI